MHPIPTYIPYTFRYKPSNYLTSFTRTNLNLKNGIIRKYPSYPVPPPPPHPGSKMQK